MAPLCGKAARLGSVDLVFIRSEYRIAYEITNTMS
jgi:hypothetical protein